MVPIDEAGVVEKGALGPGQMIGVHMGRGELCRDEDLKNRMAEGLPFSDWVGSMVDLEAVTCAADEGKTRKKRSGPWATIRPRLFSPSSTGL